MFVRGELEYFWMDLFCGQKKVFLYFGFEIYKVKSISCKYIFMESKMF